MYYEYIVIGSSPIPTCFYYKLWLFNFKNINIIKFITMNNKLSMKVLKKYR